MFTHTGSCHCGIVKYTFQISPSIEEHKAITCNCSFCTASGRLFIHIPNTDFTYTEGTDNLSEYRFGSMSITASFCKTCGIQLAAESRAEKFLFGMVGVNMRTVDGLDIDTLELKKFNGKDFTLPPYSEKV
ncbi:hypothetical protein TMatcc_000102 [Talaromyces marneffei ATCC 18224]|uniref:uncharacterized protein n=1 Tax=Talaromyces marneffei TaxID=37727 RepID=UPI0012A86BA0|nr:uncharacterized protein EYB26_005190 [Talaromyces marneffei]KAE8549141.1 hypothetical protein EYB25_007656 [Talaromyces marneffei]QGA17519.1 hypothetical protein EYB26_005190 [Talaromyces marneffei]